MTTQFEAWKRRMKKLDEPIVNRKEIKKKILHYQKVAHLFHACGKLSELQVKVLQKQLKR